jgi:hypothetical protein
MSISDCAFEDCSSMVSIEQPAGLTSLGRENFRDCC